MKRLLVALGATVLFLVLPELALRGSGYRHVPAVRFGWPDPVTIQTFAWSPDLFWTYAPGPEINAQGFRGRSPDAARRAGVERLLFVGDSCTAIGRPKNFAALVEDELRDGEDAAYETLTFAVPGYSSYQGRVAVERYGAAAAPDLVFVYFGWNDHWTARGAVDAEKRVPAPRPWLESLRSRSRLVQLVTGLGDAEAEVPADEELPARVPPADFTRNLRAIHAFFEARGVPVVFVTAPSGFARLGVPAFVTEDGLAPSAAEAVRRHAEYAELVRAVARDLAARGAELLDLAAELEARDDLEELLMHDHLHLSRRGREVVARRVAAYVRARARG